VQISDWSHIVAKRRRRGTGAVRRLPSGRYQAKVRVDGIYYPAPATFDVKEAATVWLHRQLDAIDDGSWNPPTDASKLTDTFGDYAEVWLASRKLKPRTAAQYRGYLDDYLIPAWGKRKMRTIAVAQVESCYHELKLPPTTKSHVYGLLRTILNGAWRRDLIESNPCRVEGAGAAKRQTRTEIPTAEQIAALAAAMPSSKYQAMVLVSAWCGLRFGETTELRRSDFVVDDDGLPTIVRVRRAVTRVNGEFVVGTPKSEAGVRDVVIPPHIRPVLQAYLQTLPDGSKSLVFPASRTGGHIQPSSLYKPFYRARTAVGLPKLRWHDLRHFAGTTAAVAGATMGEVMARLGHSTQHAAMRYQGVAANRDAAIATALSDNVIPIKRGA
jgi:integrase